MPFLLPLAGGMIYLLQPVLVLSLDELPPCANTDLILCKSGCYTRNRTAFEGTCPDLDNACLCKSQSYLEQISCCISDSCPPYETTGIFLYQQKACNDVHVSISSSVPCPTTTGGTIAPPVASNVSSSSSGSSALFEVKVTYPLSSFLSTTTLSSLRQRPTTVTDSVIQTFQPAAGGAVSTVSGPAMAVTSLVQATPSITAFSPVRILTGTCTSPRITYATDLAGQLMQFAWMGCSHEQPDCCPFGVCEERTLTACPVNYTTTSGACCPSGFSVYTTAFAQGTPCYSSLSVGLALATSTSTPSHKAAAVLVTNLVFTRKFDLASENGNEKERGNGGLSHGVYTGIVVGSVTGAFSLGILSVCFCLRRRKKKKKKREKMKALEQEMLSSSSSQSNLPPNVAEHLARSQSQSKYYRRKGPAVATNAVSLQQEGMQMQSLHNGHGYNNHYPFESAAVEVVEVEGDLSNDPTTDWANYYATGPSINSQSHSYNSQNVVQLLLSQQPDQAPPQSPKELPGNCVFMPHEDRYRPVFVLADCEVGRNAGPFAVTAAGSRAGVHSSG
ncbi:hypothetical protein M432DRAFT_593247 [Thermoascus aurantiacus ATCC 26904]